MWIVSHAIPFPSITIRDHFRPGSSAIRFDQVLFQRALLVFGVCLFIIGLTITAGLPGGDSGTSPLFDGDDEEPAPQSNGIDEAAAGSDNTDGTDTENESSEGDTSAEDTTDDSDGAEGDEEEASNEETGNGESDGSENNGTEGDATPAESGSDGSGENDENETDQDGADGGGEGNETDRNGEEITNENDGSGDGDGDPIFGGSDDAGSETDQGGKPVTPMRAEVKAEGTMKPTKTRKPGTEERSSEAETKPKARTTVGVSGINEGGRVGPSDRLPHQQRDRSTFEHR